jgi:hypothetical protein
MRSDLERAFLTQWRVLNQEFQLPDPFDGEFRFAAHHVGSGKGIRKRLALSRLCDWRSDLAWPDHYLLVELEGGTFTRGRHVRPTGYANDCLKYNAAQRLGYVVLRYTSTMVYDDFRSIMLDIQEMLKR